MNNILFSGYAALWGRVDDRNTTLSPRAFALHNQPNIKIPLLYHHWRHEILGEVLKLEETNQGLWMEGVIYSHFPKSQGVIDMIKEGLLTGLSVGYKADLTIKKRQSLTIKRASLYEISVVTFPAQANTRIEQWRLA